MSEPKFRAVQTEGRFWKVEMLSGCCECKTHRYRTVFYAYQLLPFETQRQFCERVAELLNAEAQP